MSSTVSLVRAALLGAGAIFGASATIQLINTSIDDDEEEKDELIKYLSDGISAVENIAFYLSNSIFILSPTVNPQYRCLGDETAHLSAALRTNIFGSGVNIVTGTEPQAYVSEILSQIRSGEKVTLFAASGSSILYMIPLMYQVADEALPCVLHAFPGSVAGDLSYQLKYEEVFAARQTGFAFLASQNVQECQDMAVIAHVASVKAKTPFLHLFDSAYHAQEGVSLKSAQELDSILELLKVGKSEEKEASDNLYLQSGTRSQEHVPAVLDSVMEELEGLLNRRYELFEYTGPEDPTSVLVVFGAGATVAAANAPEDVGVLLVRLLKPFSEQHFLSALPSTTTRIAVLEHTTEDTEEWGPLFLDVVASVQTLESNPLVISHQYGGNLMTSTVANSVFANLTAQTPYSAMYTQCQASNSHVPAVEKELPAPSVKPEASYVKILKQALGERVGISNSVEADNVWGGQGNAEDFAEYGNIEYGYGVLLSKIQKRKQLVAAVSEVLTLPQLSLGEDLQGALKEWLAVRDDSNKCARTAAKVQSLIREYETKEDDDNLTLPALKTVLREAELFVKPSQWLLGSSKWAYDLSYSGIRHVITSQQNVNLLIVDTCRYTEAKREEKGKNWKKDVGLYAMNYGGVYVASVAMYASYTQVLRAMMEADAYPGPAIVLAYAPQVKASKDPLALAMLKEHKLAVDTGAWPLYRWNPSLQQPFNLDSQFIKKQMEAFLKRENILSMLVREVPAVDKALSTSLETEIKEHHTSLQKEAVSSYLSLLKGLSSTEPLLIIYGSDGGNATGVAKRLEAEALSRGLDARSMVMDECSVDVLAEELNVVAVVSTAGQGEFPGNAKNFWTHLGSSSPDALSNTKFAVFGLGDRHYWPRAEDAHYFCKAAVDIDQKLNDLGGQRMFDVALGDDQDDDGYETQFAVFQPALWEKLGVGGASKVVPKEEVTPDQAKIESNFLRGTILKGLEDESTGSLSASDTGLTKFHGIYQQDDRDLRESRRTQGLEKAYSFMIRVRVPGGVCTPAQYLGIDELSTNNANGTIKITTRQAWQLHGVIKSKLKKTVHDINMTLMDTLAACGDVNRNVMASPLADSVNVQNAVTKFARDVSDHLTPRTAAYHEIWMDKKMVAGHVDEEPLYGSTYLPRKFKIAISVPPYNDQDIYAHCCGMICIVENNELLGFNVTVGGGMGMTHNNPKTYPRTGSDLGFVRLDQAIKVCESIMLTQRDNGERLNRKHSRMKYTVEDMGIDAFRAEVESRCGHKIEMARPFKFESNSDRFNWIQTDDGNWHYGMYIENGRIKDTPDYPLRTAMREIANMHTGDFRLTGNANLIIGNCTEAAKQQITAIMAKYKIGNNDKSALRLNSMACAALPYCALAFAESERYLPSLIGKVEGALEDAGLRDDAIVIRMTGCPNGCARPYVAEIGFVGRAPGVYNLYLGAGHSGERLSKLYKASLNEEQIISELKPLFYSYAAGKEPGEPFGDYVIRKGVVAKTTNGADFWNNIAVQE